ncbi:MAG: hypothetical protein QOE92_1455, partial [Chloroflexota bacterium]|nr:hypothetical protein [Chloroflexota bacterium]
TSFKPTFPRATHFVQRADEASEG